MNDDRKNNIIENILGSRGKVKILKTIYSLGEANITRIVRETRMNHKLVSKHLESLVKAGFLVEKIYGRIKIYSINFSNPKTILLKDIFNTLEEE